MHIMFRPNLRCSTIIFVIPALLLASCGAQLENTATHGDDEASIHPGVAVRMTQAAELVIANIGFQAIKRQYVEGNPGCFQNLAQTPDDLVVAHEATKELYHVIAVGECWRSAHHTALFVVTTVSGLGDVLGLQDPQVEDIQIMRAQTIEQEMTIYQSSYSQEDNRLYAELPADDELIDQAFLAATKLMNAKHEEDLTQCYNQVVETLASAKGELSWHDVSSPLNRSIVAGIFGFFFAGPGQALDSIVNTKPSPPEAQMIVVGAIAATLFFSLDFVGTYIKDAFETEEQQIASFSGQWCANRR